MSFQQRFLQALLRRRNRTLVHKCLRLQRQVRQLKVRCAQYEVMVNQLLDDLEVLTGQSIDALDDDNDNDNDNDNGNDNRTRLRQRQRQRERQLRAFQTRRSA